MVKLIAALAVCALMLCLTACSETSGPDPKVEGAKAAQKAQAEGKTGGPKILADEGAAK